MSFWATLQFMVTCPNACCSELLLEEHPRPMQSYLGGAQGYLQNLGDLLIGELVSVSEKDHRPIVSRQLHDSFANMALCIALFCDAFWRTEERSGRHIILQRGGPLAALLVVDDQVHRNLVHPG